MTGPGGRLLALGALVGTLALAGGARAEAAPPAPAASADQPAADQPPAWKFNLNQTLDLWDNASGGFQTGGTVLSKLRVSATWSAERLGDPDFTAHVQLIAVNGRPFSGDFVGDIQTLSNIEAPTAVRLEVASVQQAFGDKGSIAFGLLDLNHTFDIHYPVALFTESSDAIAPEISLSGANGPSIYPTTSAGAVGVWTPNKWFSLRLGAFDGVSGDPDHPGAFLIARLARSDGVLAIGQADWNFSDIGQASIGAWSYTAATDPIDPARPGQARQAGVYAFVDGPITKQIAGWVRIGFSNPTVDQVSNFVGGGLVWTGPIPSRKNDQAGVAFARAGLSGDAQRIDDLPAAETEFEATYLFVANDHLSLQPDVQYIVHPALAPHLPNALAIGLRISITFDAPSGATDTED